MAAYAVAKVGDVPEGTHIIVEARGREIGIFNVHGHYYALPNNCFHQNGPVCQGAVSGAITASAETGWRRVWSYDGEIVMCPWHALEFNIKTGQCLALANKRLATYPVQVEGDVIVVEM